MWALFNIIGRLYCKAFHRSIMWAGASHYRCSRCSRVFRVPWSTE